MIPVLDPWISITQMATLTKRLRFITSVLRMPIRKPLMEAKTACSVAYVANDRLAIGMGLGWMPEEFKFTNEDKKTRGARVDEAIQIMRLALAGGYFEFHGKYYDFDRVIMEPHPQKKIPIYVGGTTEPAIRRATRYSDGWLGIMHGFEEVKKIIPELRRQRKEWGHEKEPFDILLQCPEATSVDDIRRLEDLGVTHFWIVPWTYYAQLNLPANSAASMFLTQPLLQTKLDAIRRYGDEVISKFSS